MRLNPLQNLSRNGNYPGRAAAVYLVYYMYVVACGSQRLIKHNNVYTSHYVCVCVCVFDVLNMRYHCCVCACVFAYNVRRVPYKIYYKCIKVLYVANTKKKNWSRELYNVKTRRRGRYTQAGVVGLDYLTSHDIHKLRSLISLRKTHEYYYITVGLLLFLLFYI
jgi:hypothetical protein